MGRRLNGELKYLTQKNVERAVSLIRAKGYDAQTANYLALSCFENSKRNNMSVEWWIDKIISAEEHARLQ